ncbi:MAG: dinitrogenase iron-molybdenum cofactor biosynthesis protein, partial [Oscillospiraceae bacterium]|nr:dinitrogenase iron-molybdenum cofactor biosynthesis protein [Oscillospiraceae bacterium]
MSEEYMEQQGCDCGGDCDDCGGDCGSCGGCGSQDLHAPLNAQSKVKKVIGIVSGKGGVGKS